MEINLLLCLIGAALAIVIAICLVLLFSPDIKKAYKSVRLFQSNSLLVVPRDGENLSSSPEEKMNP